MSQVHTLSHTYAQTALVLLPNHLHITKHLTDSNLGLFGICFLIWTKPTSVTRCTDPPPLPTQGVLYCFPSPQAGSHPSILSTANVHMSACFYTGSLGPGWERVERPSMP